MKRLVEAELDESMLAAYRVRLRSINLAAYVQ